MGMADRAINYMFGDLKKSAKAIKQNREKTDKRAQEINKKTNPEPYKNKSKY